MVRAGNRGGIWIWIWVWIDKEIGKGGGGIAAAALRVDRRIPRACLLCRSIRQALRAQAEAWRRCFCGGLSGGSSSALGAFLACCVRQGALKNQDVAVHRGL